jgi:hypothetical protein
MYLGVGFEHIPHSSDGMYQFLLKIPIDFVAQTTDQHVDHIGLRVE